MSKRLHVKYMFFLSDFNQTCIFSKGFRKTLIYQSFIKICPMGAELFHAEEQT